VAGPEGNLNLKGFAEAPEFRKRANANALTRQLQLNREFNRKPAQPLSSLPFSLLFFSDFFNGLKKGKGCCFDWFSMGAFLAKVLPLML
jgi:hypothetical protein